MTDAPCGVVGTPTADAGADAHDDELDRLRGDLDRHRADLATATALAGHLQEALQSNRRIGMAVGVLMERHKLTSDQAFDRLHEASSRGNIKLRDLAEHVLYTGESPRAAPRQPSVP